MRSRRDVLSHNILLRLEQWASSLRLLQACFKCQWVSPFRMVWDVFFERITLSQLYMIPADSIHPSLIGGQFLMHFLKSHVLKCWCGFFNTYKTLRRETNLDFLNKAGTGEGCIRRLVRSEIVFNGYKNTIEVHTMNTVNQDKTIRKKLSKLNQNNLSYRQGRFEYRYECANTLLLANPLIFSQLNIFDSSFVAFSMGSDRRCCEIHFADSTSRTGAATHSFVQAFCPGLLHVEEETGTNRR